MDTDQIVALAKESLGIRSSVRDTLLKAITDGVVKELKDEKGLVLDGANPHHLLFVTDYVAWRYQSRDSSGTIPRHLQFRMHNLMIHTRGGGGSS